MKVQGKTIVVTGGGGGLGRSLVIELLRRGAAVAAVDINEKALALTRQHAGAPDGRLSLHVLDITDRELVADFPAEVIATHGSVDGLINNAGIIQPFVPVNDLDMKTIERVMNVNFYGTLYLVKAFLPHFLGRPEAHIVNISSLGGFMPFPGQTIYGASKAAVKLLTEGLYSELKGTHVRVTVIHPGAVRTDIMSNSGLEQAVSSEGVEEQGAALHPDLAAGQIVEAMVADKYRATVGRDSFMLDLLYRIAPRFATNIIQKKMKDQQLPGSTTADSTKKVSSV